MQRLFLSLSFLILIFWAVSCGRPKQILEPANNLYMYGTVTDATGQNLVGVNVEIESQDGVSLAKATVTGKNGFFMGKLSLRPTTGLVIIKAAQASLYSVIKVENLSSPAYVNYRTTEVFNLLNKNESFENAHGTIAVKYGYLPDTHILGMSGQFNAINTSTAAAQKQIVATVGESLLSTLVGDLGQSLFSQIPGLSSIIATGDNTAVALAAIESKLDNVISTLNVVQQQIGVVEADIAFISAQNLSYFSSISHGNALDACRTTKDSIFGTLIGTVNTNIGTLKSIYNLIQKYSSEIIKDYNGSVSEAVSQGANDCTYYPGIEVPATSKCAFYTQFTYLNDLLQAATSEIYQNFNQSQNFLIGEGNLLDECQQLLFWQKFPLITSHFYELTFSLYQYYAFYQVLGYVLVEWSLPDAAPNLLAALNDGTSGVQAQKDAIKPPVPEGVFVDVRNNLMWMPITSRPLNTSFAQSPQSGNTDKILTPLDTNFSSSEELAPAWTHVEVFQSNGSANLKHAAEQQFKSAGNKESVPVFALPTTTQWSHLACNWQTDAATFDAWVSAHVGAVWPSEYDNLQKIHGVTTGNNDMGTGVDYPTAFGVWLDGDASSQGIPTYYSGLNLTVGELSFEPDTPVKNLWGYLNNFASLYNGKVWNYCTASVPSQDIGFNDNEIEYSANWLLRSAGKGGTNYILEGLGWSYIVVNEMTCSEGPEYYDNLKQQSLESAIQSAPMYGMPLAVVQVSPIEPGSYWVPPPGNPDLAPLNCQ